MHPVLTTIIQRLGLGLLTLFVVTVIIFSSIEFLPGDFGEAVLGQAALPETVEAFRRELGLDRPPVERYFMWAGNVTNMTRARPAASLLTRRCAPSQTIRRSHLHGARQ